MYIYVHSWGRRDSPASALCLLSACYSEEEKSGYACLLYDGTIRPTQGRKEKHLTSLCRLTACLCPPATILCLPASYCLTLYLPAFLLSHCLLTSPHFHLSCLSACSGGGECLALYHLESSHCSPA